MFKSKIIKPQQVIDYLKQHPSFFKENVALLCHIDIDGEKESTPFHERQIATLKGRESQQQTTIDFIIDSAKNNQRLENGLLEMAIHLLGNKTNKKSAIEIVSTLIEQQFKVHEAVILLDNQQDNRHARYDDVRQRVIHHGSICDDRVSSELRTALFVHSAKTIKSCAFVPLVFANQIKGVMILGSRSKTRFQAGIGVMFLDRLGLLVGGYFQGNTTD